MTFFSHIFPTVPSATRNVTVERVSSNSIRISWEPPESINGILQMYTVRVMRGLSTVVIHSSTVNATESSDVITGLETGSYSITVVAITGAGEGIPSDSVEFTLTTTTISKICIVLYVRSYILYICICMYVCMYVCICIHWPLMVLP